MALSTLFILIGASLAVTLVSWWPAGRKLRNPLLQILSILAVFWLQPALPVRGLDFWLPVATLVITILGWVLTSLPQERYKRATLFSAGLTIAVILGAALTRHLSLSGLLTPSRPPPTWIVLVTLPTLALIISLLLIYTQSKNRATPVFLSIAIFALLAAFIVLKLPSLTTWTSGLLRSLGGQSSELASALDLRWLGFSYIAFRLIHTLRDRQSGRLPAMALQEYFVYVLFFPALSAGPIDRSERFLRDLRQPFIPGAETLGNSARRLVFGLFKKFVLADLLAIVALSAVNAGQIQSTGWAWIMLFAFSFQIFFDFSGYTDLAIGMGILMGVTLPENFNTPYRKPNLTQFWNNWHMTLTQWLRAYVFNPLTRALRSGPRPVPAWMVIFITQIITMSLIGLWHGITLNFLLWGLWHGLGMFIQNRFTDLIRPLSARVQTQPALNHWVTAFTTLMTFVYVSLGWVWFALPSTQLSLRIFSLLFGGTA